MWSLCYLYQKPYSDFDLLLKLPTEVQLALFKFVDGDEDFAESDRKLFVNTVHKISDGTFSTTKENVNPECVA